MQEMPFEAKPVGLIREEVILLTGQFGKNEFSADKRGGFLRKVWDIIKEPMFVMLVIACMLYFVLGEIKEGLLMVAAMVFVGAISFYQEIKSAHALAALQQYTQPMIMVIRDGQEQAIQSRDLVPGDMMVVAEGNLIPADATILQSNDCSVNESVITGESMPVDKNASEGANILFQGATVNSGKCLARVTAIGNNTVLGKLGKSLSEIGVSKTQLQKQIGQFVKVMATIGMVFFCLIWLVNYLHTRELIQSLLLGLTLSMSIIPEEIPVAFSSFMALGAFRMTKLGIITRQPLTIENLGAVSVVCLDKTGTITENRMEVKKVYDFDRDILEEMTKGSVFESREILRYARLASEREPFDAMEKAIVAAYELYPQNETQIPKMVHEYPLGGQPPMMTHVYDEKVADIVSGKGAPERIIAVCLLDPQARSRVQAMVTLMASEGMRVLGVCGGRCKHGEYPEKQDDFSWQFKGLVALYDPPKEEVKGEFEKWYAAGIKIKLVTGDFRETAGNIAAQVGMMGAGKIIKGDEVMKMEPDGLSRTSEETSIFARMFPEAKLKLIEALKANGEIVAMMGDGVNDGPALRSAHIGIAMGGRGTEIARQAAALILTDDNLGKVTEAISQGRKIYQNLKKAVRYIVSIHVPIILTASVPLLLNWKYPNIFTPIHVIFLELIMGPTCSVFFENEPVEAGMMQKPPRARSTTIFTARELLSSVLQGVVIAAGILGLYYYFMEKGVGLSYVRTIVFITLIVSNVFLTFVNRSFEETIFKTIRYKNNLTKYVLLASIFFLGCIAFIPIVQGLFGLTLLRTADYGLCLGVGLIITLWFEVYKMLIRKR
jgi:P-type Ca2+ transporter type 2C